MIPRAPGFDRIAPLYRAMEYLSFGRVLERCRFFYLPRLSNARRALVLGDGDGRFLARLLAANPQLHADAIDASPAMLRLLESRAARAGARHRVSTHCADARAFAPANTYDLVVTHFFLDCLAPAEVVSLIARLRPHLVPGARWLVSEFQVPTHNRACAWIARRIIASLYAAFRLLTGLRVSQIPPWQDFLSCAGFARQACRLWLGGLLVSELWQATDFLTPQSHQPVTSPDIRLRDVPGIDPGPLPSPDPKPDPESDPAPGPPPDPDTEPWPGPLPTPQPVT
jgi:SAM-dependent methyltransferase